MRRMARDGCLDFPRFPRRMAADDGEVALLHGLSGELVTQDLVGLVVLGDDEAAAGLLVEAVHDTRAGHAADATEAAPAVMEQGVDQGVFLVAGGRMHDDAGRLVEDQQVVVFVENVERDVFGLGIRRAGFGPVDGNRFARPRLMGGFDGSPVDLDVSLVNQPLNGAPRDGGEAGGKEFVEPFAGQRLLDDQVFGAFGAAHLRSVTQGLYFGDGGIGSGFPSRFSQDRMSSSPTPMQIALSATLKAGKLAGSPFRRTR